MATGPTLVFLYRASRKAWGSTTMRSEQLAKLVTPHLQDMQVQVQVLSRHEILQNLWAHFVHKGATIFATKDVVKVLSPSAVHVLHARGCRVCLDVVDMRRDYLPGPELGADCFISPSLNGLSVLKDYVQQKFPLSGHRPLVMPVLHNADSRLYGKHLRPRHEAKIAYWGAMKNVLITPAIANQIDLIDGSDSGSFQRSLDLILDYNVHYAIRPDATEQRIKPFTKGVNAAVLGALVLADRGVQDAAEMLGDDYPFLLDDTEEATVLTGIARMKGAFGGSDWRLAQERVTHMANQVSPAALADQLRAMIKAVGG